MSPVKWTEVWIDEPGRGTYVLVVRGHEDGTIQVADPQKTGAIVREFKTYEDATLWLREDEFQRVEGRCDFDWD